MLMMLTVLGQVITTGGFTIDMGEVRLIADGDQAHVAMVPAQEMLQNPGFESGSLTPWYTNASWTISTIFPHSGTYCASDTGNYWIRQDFAQPVPSDSIVSITLWSRQPENGAQAVELFYDDMSYTYVILFPTGAWQQFDATSCIATGKTATGLRVWGYVGGGPAPDSTYIDDLSVMANVPAEVAENPAVPQRSLSASPSVFSGLCRVSCTTPGRARLVLYNAQGARLSELWAGEGSAEVCLDGEGLCPGIYILRLEGQGGGLSTTLIRR